MIFDALKNKLLGSLQPAEDSPSFKVDWNPHDPNFILMGSNRGSSYVVYCADMKNLRVTTENLHTNEVFGVQWNPNIRDEYLVGCSNGDVILCNMNDGSQKKFIGHDKRVFNVAFSKQNPHIFASGSDDNTIRVWNKDAGEVLKVLKGHTHNVRAIIFNPELPWCLVSGSWDATIKLWDVRSGACIYTITDHTADVYGITFHKERPFNFVSSSRDTTLRFWSID